MKGDIAESEDGKVVLIVSARMEAVNRFRRLFNDRSTRNVNLASKLATARSSKAKLALISG